MPKSIRTPANQSLLDILIETRRKAGLTQLALAKRIGRPQSFVAKYENGERRLDVVEFVNLIKAMDGSPTKVFARFVSSMD